MSLGKSIVFLIIHRFIHLLQVCIIKVLFLEQRTDIKIQNSAKENKIRDSQVNWIKINYNCKEEGKNHTKILKMIN